MGRHVVLIGEGDLAEEVRRGLDDGGAEVYRLKAPGEREMRHAVEVDGIDCVIVVSPDDAFALRIALMARSMDEKLPLLVTIFDPTMAGQVEEAIEHCDVTSMADIVAPSLAGPCLGDDLDEVRASDPPVGVRGDEEVAVEVPARRRAAASPARSSRPTTRAPRCCCGARWACSSSWCWRRWRRWRCSARGRSTPPTAPPRRS